MATNIEKALDEGDEVRELVLKLTEEGMHKEVQELADEFTKACDEAERKFPLFPKYHDGEVIPFAIIGDAHIHKAFEGYTGYMGEWMAKTRIKYADKMDNKINSLK